MRIIFFGSDKYSLVVLNQISSDKRFKLVGVVTHFSPCPVEDFSKTLYEVKLITVREFDKEFIARLKELEPEVGVLASFGKILPKEILEVPKKGILNIHPSLLPKYRGASPVQAAILAGDKEAGVSIIKMDEKMDHGPIISQFTEIIRPEDTAESLYLRLFEEGAKVLLTILPAYLEGKIEPREQDHQKATFTKPLKKEDGKLNWTWEPEKIERFIRAMSPWPGAYTKVKLKIKNEKLTKRLKILKAHLETEKLVLDQVQLEGKKPVSWKQFCEGYPGTKFVS